MVSKENNQKKNSERILQTIYEKTQDLAMHYNLKIWTVFSVGVAFSLWILYKTWVENSLEEIFKIAMLTLGYLVLIYCSLAVESFGQKKRLYQEIKNKINEIIGIDEKSLIDGLPSHKTLEYWEVLILSFILFFYIFSFIFLSFSFDKFIAWAISTLMFLGYLFVLKNWIKGYNYRPKIEGDAWELINKFINKKSK